MVSAMCRLALAAAALGASACTITLGTGTGVQQPQPVYVADGSGGAQPAPQQPQPQPIQVGGVAPQPAPGPVAQPPTPVYTPAQPPHRVGTPSLTHGGSIVLPRGSVFGGDGNTFRGQLYFFDAGARSIPNFASMQPQAVTFTDHFNIPLTNSQGSLPEWPDRLEGFGLEWTGNFNVTAAGTYDFSAYSAHGANVYVDGQLVVNNDGIHDPKGADGKVTLTQGSHAVRIDYYVPYRWVVELQVYVRTPSGAQELFGPSI